MTKIDLPPRNTENWALAVEIWEHIQPPNPHGPQKDLYFDMPYVREYAEQATIIANDLIAKGWRRGQADEEFVLPSSSGDSMKSNMLTQKESVSKAHATITSAHPEVRNWLGLSDVLDQLYDEATQRAAFDHQMLVLAYRYAQAIDKIGPEVVAERLGISIDKLSQRISPEAFGELTMSELRLLSLVCELEIGFEVIPTPGPTSDKETK